MNDKLLHQLVRQMKILNFFIASFGVLILASIIVIGFLLWQVITFVQDVNQRVENTREQLNVRQQACENERLGNFLQRNSDLCRQERSE